MSEYFRKRKRKERNAVADRLRVLKGSQSFIGACTTERSSWPGAWERRSQAVRNKDICL